MLERARGGVSFRRMSEKAPLLMLGLPKGSLEESTKNLFAKAGWKITTSTRSYRPSIDDPELDVRADDVLVLRNAGPRGAPGMPEAGYLPIPRKLARQGVKDMVRISDARMSGTAFGTVVLHIAPESAAGGLITAALLAVPGASAYCLGGIVIYTRQAWEAVRDFEEGLLEGHRSATEANALIRARIAREKFKATWGIGETGAAGPTGNRYGDPAGHAWLAIAGSQEKTLHVLTGDARRLANMHAFAAAALRLFEQAL